MSHGGPLIIGGGLQVSSRIQSCAHSSITWGALNIQSQGPTWDDISDWVDGAQALVCEAQWPLANTEVTTALFYEQGHTGH